MSTSYQYRDIYNSSLADLKMRLSLLYGNSVGGLAVSFLSMTVLCFGFNTPDQQSTKTAIWSALLICHVLRFSDNLYTRKFSLNKDHNLHFACIRYCLGIFANSAIFAAYSILLVPTMSTMEVTISAIILSALAGGTITVMSASFIMSTLYMSALLLPYAFSGFYSELEYFYIISYLGIIFWVVMIASAREATTFMTDVLEIKNINSSMLIKMAEEKAEIERVNTELSVANNKLDNYTHRLKSEVEKRTEQIYRLSNIDPLTGLNNRTAFLQEIEFVLNNSVDQQYALLFIDLDGFKDVNDGFGHQVGDAVLSEVASRLAALSHLFQNVSAHSLQAKNKDCICRWGGDEFLILYKINNATPISEILNIIKTRIHEPMSVASNNISIDTSIGVSMFPHDSTSPNELIQFADIAMYKHKEEQTASAVFFTPALLEKFQHNQFIRDGLKDALANKEFSIAFQPIIDIENMEVWAFEALLRWTHKGQAISPHEFIPIAEKSGHIVSIGKWVLIQACKEAMKCKLENKPSLSVNVSAIQLLEPDFIEILDFALQESGLSPSQLHIEITESVMIEESAAANARLKEIVERGVHISIDDFGTGYSSLHQLQSLSFDIIKVDRSFITHLSEKDRTIVSATKLIADEFNAKTIAEGIETEEELSIIRSIGIRYIQGYYFAKPMPITQIEDWYVNEFSSLSLHK